MNKSLDIERKSSFQNSNDRKRTNNSEKFNNGKSEHLYFLTRGTESRDAFLQQRRRREHMQREELSKRRKKLKFMSAS